MRIDRNIPAIIFGLVLSVGAGQFVTADTGGQVTVFAAAALVENPSNVQDLPEKYQDTDDEDLFGGIEGEIWFDRLGIGMRHAVRFDRRQVEVLDESKTPATSSQKDAWWYDAKSDMFAAFHLFGGGSFIDPYLRYGVGFATRTSLNEDYGFDREREVWTTAEAPKSDDGDEDEYSEELLVSAGMYQYIGAGLQCNLSGLVLGVGVNYNVLHQQFSRGDYDWEEFPGSRFEARIYGGVAF